MPESSVSSCAFSKSWPNSESYPSSSCRTLTACLTFRIISTQICEVEVQTIVLVEFNNDMDNYKKDVKRESGKDVSYDKEIAGKYKDIKKDDGSLNQEDLGFSGSDVGKNNVTPQGNNWDDASGPQKVGEAEDAAGKALNKEPEA